MLRILSMLTFAIACLYALEFVGIVPERAYFPTLPRLEKAEAANASNWTEAAAWGTRLASCASSGQAIATCREAATDKNVDTPSQAGRFTDRISAKTKPSA
jgi:hypothetical protein